MSRRLKPLPGPLPEKPNPNQVVILVHEGQRTSERVPQATRREAVLTELAICQTITLDPRLTSSETPKQS